VATFLDMIGALGVPHLIIFEIQKIQRESILPQKRWQRFTKSSGSIVKVTVGIGENKWQL